jgi:hypothetical protein
MNRSELTASSRNALIDQVSIAVHRISPPFESGEITMLYDRFFNLTLFGVVAVCMMTMVLAVPHPVKESTLLALATTDTTEMLRTPNRGQPLGSR